MINYIIIDSQTLEEKKEVKDFIQAINIAYEMLKTNKNIVIITKKQVKKER